ncbi:unnamed protein product [Ambrosiozyma monospora]|uniref:Unnamed protein product n=1 Tax=Ambrosiozyma monospora TaxID=43982 RepID=A0ACB5T0J2_AMBMO|nr:unnamed protein product [Ambrosiozyma monospora]
MTWEEATDEEGRVYYYNSETQETQWEKPDDLVVDSEQADGEDSATKTTTVKAPAEASSETANTENPDQEKIDKILAGSHWQRFTTDDNETYYYNENTEESVWELPEEIRRKLELEGVEFEDTADDKTANGGTSGEKEHKFPGNSVLKLDSYLQENHESLENLKIENYRTRVPSSKMDSSVQDEFLAMLKEGEVDSNWPFDKVMNHFIKDARYWKIKDVLLRKQLYEIYLIQKTEEELKSINNSKESYRTTFFEILGKYDIKYYTRWKTCSKLIIDEPIYSLISNKLKKEFFMDYVAKLRSKHDEEKKEKKKEALDKLTEELTSQLTIDSKIHDFIEKYVDYEGLTKLDFITVYESIMNKLELEFNKKYQKNMKLNYRLDRIARENFTKLIEEKFSGVKWLADLKWVGFVSALKDDERFIELCGHNGSSAIDFYWDLLDKENQILKGEKELVKHVLATANFKVTKTKAGATEPEDKFDEKNYNEFVKLITESKDADKVNKDNYKLIYNRLVEEATTAAAIARKRRLDNDESSPAAKKRLTTLGYGAL